MKRLVQLFSAVSSIALFAMMALTIADVFSRKFLTNSITGAVELTELFMLVMIFFALPLASFAGEHIVFDLLDRVLPAAAVRWQKSLSNALTGAAFGVASWLVWQRSQRTFDYGDTTATLELRLGPYHAMAAALLGLTAALHVWLAWRALRQAGPAR